MLHWLQIMNLWQHFKIDLHFFTVTTPAFDLSGSLIPDVYPEGDPSQYALPIFMEEPKNQFTAKGFPANLECRVAHALKVNFVCNDEVMASTSEAHVIDPETSIRYTKIVLEIRRSDAMDVIGKFVCKCRATSSKGEVDSRDASVSVASKFFCCRQCDRNEHFYVFIKNGPNRPLLLFIFGLFKQTSLQFLQEIYLKKCPSRIWCWDLNPQPLELLP